MEKNESFEISSNLFPCVCVDTYWSALSPTEREEDLQSECDTFEYVVLDLDEWKKAIASAAYDFIKENVCPIMKKYGLDDILVEEIHSPREYNFQTDCLYFSVEMSSDWRNRMHDNLIEFRKDKKFQEYIQKNWWSRDGFWSWMPKSFDEIEQMEDEERCVGAYLTLCLLNEGCEGLYEESIYYIYDSLDARECSHYYRITEDYLGYRNACELENLYNDDYRMDSLYQSLLMKIGYAWKGYDYIDGKSDGYTSITAQNDAMRLIFWALKNGYTVSDLEAMAA